MPKGLPPNSPGVARRIREGWICSRYSHSPARALAQGVNARVEQRILDTTLKTRPGDGSTHWSVRTLAAHLHVSRTIVHRFWQRHDVQPHRVERFKLSNDPQFEEKCATL